MKAKNFSSSVGSAAASSDPPASGGAVATIEAFTADLLFLGQSPAFFSVINQLAVEADSVPGGL
jgi:hypothetical protein